MYKGERTRNTGEAGGSRPNRKTRGTLAEGSRLTRYGNLLKDTEIHQLEHTRTDHGHIGIMVPQDLDERTWINTGNMDKLMEGTENYK